VERPVREVKISKLGKMFIRFEAERFNQKTKSNIGVFGAITELLEKERISPKLKIESKDILSWFSKNLLSPRPFRIEDDEYYGTCWFRETAIDHIKRAQEICNILNKLGVTTITRRSEQFDEIIYSDENQIVVRTFDNAISQNP